MEQLTAERLRTLLDYDPETGWFTWLVNRGPAKAGVRAGTARGDGYRIITIDGARHYEHRLAWLYMTGEWPPSNELDHKDTDNANNRWSNLRPATVSQNQANSSRKRSNTSGYKGVSWCRAARKWKATLGIGRRLKHLGLFGTPEEAHAAYLKAAGEAFGEYARAA